MLEISQNFRLLQIFSTPGILAQILQIPRVTVEK
jgi:hypothetical protein